MHDKIVLITGAASGIGLALATEMVNRGARVYMTDINESINAAADTINSSNAAGHAIAMQLDVRDDNAFADIVSRLMAENGLIDYLFNNAGIGYGCDAVDLTVAHYNRYIDINLRGVTNGVALVYPLMVQQGFGTIVNTASVGGLIPSALMSPYAMSKYAIVGLSDSLRLEAAPKGVKVIAMCPGAVNTPMFDSTAPVDLGDVPSTRLREFTQESRVSISPAVFAKKAIDDVLKNKSPIIHPPLFAVLVWLYRYFPKAYLWLTRANLTQELKRLNDLRNQGH